MSRLQFIQRENTGHLRRNPTTSITVGRLAGSFPQQRSVISHTESVRPSFCVSCGRAGRLSSTIVVMTTGVLKSPNGYLPVKTLNGIQMPDKSSVPVPRISHGDQPLSQPCQKQRCPLPACFYRLSEGSLARTTSQYFPVREWQEQSPTRQRLRLTRNLSNGHVHCGQRECWAGKRLLPRFKPPGEGTCPFQVSVYRIVCMKIVETFCHI